MQNETVWVVGASSGIGRAVAKKLHQNGARVILSARRVEELEKLNTEMENTAIVCPVNVCDAKTITGALQEISQKTDKINRIMIFSAAYKPGKLQDMSLGDIENIVDTNVTGVLRIIHKSVPILTQQGGGEILLCGSVAGYFGLPSSQPYSATKSAIINLAESLAYDLQKQNIRVRIINPGFVKTAMTDQNNFDMPCMITAEKAADEIIRGLNKNSFEIRFPKVFTCIMKTISLLPYYLQKIIVKRIVR